MTRLLYLENTYQFEAEAIVRELLDTEKGPTLTLDQTIFYPQGGGQPYDLGTIESDQGKFRVTEVRLSPEGEVYHYGEFDSGKLKPGDVVKLKIDEERRRLNARNHSAGHLLDVVVQNLGLPLKPGKGYHFPDGPYVEYEGMLGEPTSWIEPIQNALAELIRADLKLIRKHLSPEEAQAQGVWAPPGKSARVVYFEGHEGCGCGGTHVERSSEIGPATPRKISSKKGRTRIAYALD